MNVTSEIQRFHHNVKYICKEKKIPIRELEMKIGVSVGYLSRIHRGNKGLMLDKALLVAKILDYPLMDLLENDVWKQCRISELEAELKQLKEGDADAVV